MVQAGGIKQNEADTILTYFEETEDVGLVRDEAVGRAQEPKEHGSSLSDAELFTLLYLAGGSTGPITYDKFDKLVYEWWTEPEESVSEESGADSSVSDESTSTDEVTDESSDLHKEIDLILSDDTLTQEDQIIQKRPINSNTNRSH